MKNIIKIGITIIGILLVINFIENLDSLISEYVNYLEMKKMDGYTYSKQPKLLDFILSFIGVFLKLIFGLFLIIKPSLFTNIYIPDNIESNEEKWALKLILSFIYCLAIYLIVFGIIEVIEVIVREFQFTEKARNNYEFVRYSWTSVIPKCFSIIIGYILYKSFNEKLFLK